MKLLFGSHASWSLSSAVVALVLVFGLIAAPLASARTDAFGGASFGPALMPYTVLPEPHPTPDTLDRIRGYLPYTLLPEAHPMPDRLEMITGFLPYTETAPTQDRYGHWLVR